MTRFILRFLNGLITFAVVVVLGLSTIYAVYSLWDNQQVYDAVENTMDEMREIRAQMDAPRTQKGIEALIASAATATKEPEPTPRPAEEQILTTEVPRPEAEAVSAEVQTEEIAEAATATITETPANRPAVTVAEASAEARTEAATKAATEETTGIPTGVPTNTPAVAVTAAVAEARVEAATEESTVIPTAKPTVAPTEVTTAAPTEKPADDTPFGKLKAINPDITAWITMPGTAIDYPVLQGSSNYSYINTDVYGEFALAGSIFLDYRNDRNYEDSYSLIYGHDMSKHRMFSDVNLYKDEEFFKENHLGILLTPEGNHLLQSISCVVTSAGNSSLFNPENWKQFTPEQILEAVQEDAVQISPEGLEALKKRLDEGQPFKVVALSTCSGEFTDARTILLTLMDP